jgi:hypothetical protein
MNKRQAAIQARKARAAAAAWKEANLFCYAQQPGSDITEPVHLCMKKPGHMNRGDRVCRCVHGHEWPSFLPRVKDPDSRPATRARLPYKDDE